MGAGGGATFGCFFGVFFGGAFGCCFGGGGGFDGITLGFSQLIVLAFECLDFQ